LCLIDRVAWIMNAAPCELPLHVNFNRALMTAGLACRPLLARTPLLSQSSLSVPGAPERHTYAAAAPDGLAAAGGGGGVPDFLEQVRSTGLPSRFAGHDAELGATDAGRQPAQRGAPS